VAALRARCVLPGRGGLIIGSAWTAQLDDMVVRRSAANHRARGGLGEFCGLRVLVDRVCSCPAAHEVLARQACAVTRTGATVVDCAWQRCYRPVWVDVKWWCGLSRVTSTRWPWPVRGATQRVHAGCVCGDSFDAVYRIAGAVDVL